MNFMKFALVTIFYSVLLFGKARCQFENFPLLFNKLQPLNKAANDPRDDTGPVRFPLSPEGLVETSGVQAGASRFGFIPPNGARGRVAGAVAEKSKIRSNA